jgi:HD-GYP domain-containing protein (c-di-GMP phosphodiesterase class II)
MVNMAFKKKLFYQLSVVMVILLVITSLTTFTYEFSHLKDYVTTKSVEISKNTAKLYGMKHHESNILEDKKFKKVSVYDINNEIVFNHETEDMLKIQKNIKNISHTFNVTTVDNINIEFIHDHVEDAYYLRMKIPTDLSNNETGVIDIFYDISQTAKELYHAVYKNILELLVVIVLIFIAIYPTILYLHKNLLQKTQELSQTNIEILKLLGAAIAKRDSDTDAHNYRVTLYSLMLAEFMGLEKENIKALIKGAFLHDVGKIGISDSILLKPGKLTDDEFKIMKQHVSLGKDIIEHSKQLNDAKDVVEYHHEKYDGSGYLKGLKGEDIPINARIFSIADVFDALTSKRPYKEPFSFEKTKTMMLKLSGIHFDPKLLDIFFDIVPELYNDIKDKYSDDEVKTLLEVKIYDYVE